MKKLTIPESVETRYYQTECIGSILRDWAMGVQRALISLCTGSGKTTIFSLLLHEYLDSGMTVIILVHRDSLMNQAHERLKLFFPEEHLGRVQSDKYTDYDRPIVVAMVQSLNDERLKKIGPRTIVILDETHHYVDNQWGERALWFHEQNEETLYIGCTATHYRADNTSLGVIFEQIEERNELTYQYGILQAIRDGYLSQFQAYIVEAKIKGSDGQLYALDISDFKNEQGFIGSSEQWDKLWKAGNWGDLLYDEWFEIGGDKKVTMMFAPSVNISFAFAEWLAKEKGVVTAHVDGKGAYRWDPNFSFGEGGMIPANRDDITADFETGKIQFLSNFGVYTEGYDNPIIEILIMMRPTNSPGLYVQMFGRGLRITPELPDKKLAVLHVGFEDHQMRLVDYTSIIGTIPSKEVDQAEEALEELKDGVEDDEFQLLCSFCHDGYMIRIKGTYNAICTNCKAMVELEYNSETQLFDPSKMDGIGSHKRYVDLLRRQEVKWFLKDEIYSVGLGVSRPAGEQHAQRSLLLFPPGQFPKKPDMWVLVKTELPVADYEIIRKFGKSYSKITQFNYGEQSGRAFAFYDKDAAFDLATDFAELYSQDPMLSHKDQRWHKDEASPGQVKQLEKFGYNCEGMTKGQASKLLDYEFSIKFLRKKDLL